MPGPPVYRMLDLFAGRGGWSDGFKKQGFHPTGIDIVKSRYYKHRFIKADVMNWQPKGRYYVICASPPCAPFSQFNINTNGTADQRIGLDLVYRTFDIIQTLKPRYYIIENVANLAKFLPQYKQTIRYGKHDRTKTAYLWGNFPEIGLLQDGRTETTRLTFENNPEKLAYIPPFISEGIAKTIMNEIRH